ncbi:purine-cytosine permease family protein [Ornithinimicrobium sediminis]|uniref:purine-cytosine permease family protein n=1 Tax=Ornithinimicrobium sediminis TaxID=2904603 RepID=UPI001E33A2E6|nr:cytosine permease [Ornithinimicrobium sediminis]MCE0488279.1 cytosine permease [Ornithinimicrobium sediminis]
MSTWQNLVSRMPKESDADAPAERTMSLGRTAMLWLAANMVVTTLLTGTLFVPGVSYATALLMILTGTLVGGAVLILVGRIGTRTGLPTMVLTRGSFGRRGGYLPAAFNLIVLMGWAWVQALLAGITLNYVVERATGFSNPVLFAVIAQTIVVLLALFGHLGIQRVEPWLAVIMVAVAGYVFYTAFSTFGVSEFLAIPAQPEVITTIVVFDIVVATAISWTVLSADFNRHAMSERAGVVGTAIGYTASTFTAMALGATALGYVFLEGGEPIPFDPTVIVERFGVPLAIIIFISVMATNTMVVYGMVMSYLNVRPKDNFLVAALVIGLISIVGATWQGLLERFIDFLFLISGLFVPVFAILLVDYYILRRGRYIFADLVKDRGGAYWYSGGLNPVALLSWAVGAALAYYWSQVSPLSFGATVPVFFVTFALYLLASLLVGRRPKAQADRAAATSPPATDTVGR